MAISSHDISELIFQAEPSLGSADPEALARTTRSLAVVLGWSMAALYLDDGAFEDGLEHVNKIVRREAEYVKDRGLAIIRAGSH